MTKILEDKKIQHNSLVSKIEEIQNQNSKKISQLNTLEQRLVDTSDQILKVSEKFITGFDNYNDDLINNLASNKKDSEMVLNYNILDKNLANFGRFSEGNMKSDREYYDTCTNTAITMSINDNLCNKSNSEMMIMSNFVNNNNLLRQEIADFVKGQEFSVGICENIDKEFLDDDRILYSDGSKQNCDNTDNDVIGSLIYDEDEDEFKKDMPDFSLIKNEDHQNQINKNQNFQKMDILPSRGIMSSNTSKIDITPINEDKYKNQDEEIGQSNTFRPQKTEGTPTKDFYEIYNNEPNTELKDNYLSENTTTVKKQPVVIPQRQPIGIEQHQPDNLDYCSTDNNEETDRILTPFKSKSQQVLSGGDKTDDNNGQENLISEADTKINSFRAVSEDNKEDFYNENMYTAWSSIQTERKMSSDLIQKKDEEIWNLTKNLDSQANDFGELVEDNKNLKQEIESLQENLRSYKTKYQQIMQQVDNLTKELDQSRYTQKNSEDEDVSFEPLGETHRLNINDVTIKDNNLLEENENLKKKIAELENNKKNIQMRLSMSKKNSIEVNSQILNQKENNEDLQNKSEKLKKDYETKCQELEALKKKFSWLSKQSEDQQQQLHNESSDDIVGENQTLLTIVELLEKEKENSCLAQQKLETIKDSKEFFIEQVKELQSNQFNTKAKFDEMEKDYNKLLESKLTEECKNNFEESCQDLDTEIERLKYERDILNEALSDIRNVMKDQEYEFEVNMGKIQVLEVENDSQKDRIRKLEIGQKSCEEREAEITGVLSKKFYELLRMAEKANGVRDEMNLDIGKSVGCMDEIVRSEGVAIGGRQR